MKVGIALAAAWLLLACGQPLNHRSLASKLLPSEVLTSCPARMPRQTYRDLTSDDVLASERVLSQAVQVAARPDSLLVVVDNMLWLHWLQRARGTVTVHTRAFGEKVSSRQLRVVACVEEGASRPEAFNLDIAPDASAAIEPRALRMLASEWRRETRDSVTTIAESDVVLRRGKSLVDTLFVLETTLSTRAPRPIVLLLFSSAEAFAQTFPIRWSDGRFGDYSVMARGLPSVSFVAQRHESLSSHELVHLMLTKARGQARFANDAMPYVAEEALARQFGGSNGISSRVLFDARSIADARTRMVDAVQHDIALTSVPYVGAEQFGDAVDVLGLVLRVAVARCREFPDHALRRSRVANVRTAVAYVADIMHTSSDSVISWAASTAVTRETAFAELSRAATTPTSRRDCR